MEQLQAIQEELDELGNKALEEIMEVRGHLVSIDMVSIYLIYCLDDVRLKRSTMH